MDLLLMEAAHAGDVEAAVALYEPNASFVQDSGEVVTDHAAISELMKGFLALKPHFTMKVDAVQSDFPQAWATTQNELGIIRARLADP